MGTFFPATIYFRVIDQFFNFLLLLEFIFMRHRYRYSNKLKLGHVRVNKISNYKSYKNFDFIIEKCKTDIDTEFLFE